MACNFLPPMNTYRDISAGLETAHIMSSSELVSYYLLDITGILLCSWEILMCLQYVKLWFY